MFFRSQILILFLSLLFCQSLVAQINAGKDVTICYGDNVTLVATVDTAVKKYYPIYFNGEDYVHDSVFKIGFKFNFFGEDYEKFVISPNGWISFDTTLAGTRSCFRSKSIPNSNLLDSVPMNAILFPWQDWFPNVDDGSYTGYTVLGNGITERLVINFFNVQLKGVTNERGTLQAILYKVSGEIHIHLTRKPSAGNYLDNLATVGLHNADGTKGVPAADSLNGMSWVVQNQSWKFVKGGPNGYMPSSIPFDPEIIGEISEVEWYKGSYPGVCVDTGEILHLYNNQQTADYIAVIILNNAIVFTDTVRVTVNSPLLAEAGPDDTIVMGEKASLNGIPGGGSGSYQCKWSPSSYVDNPVSCTTETVPLDASRTFYFQVTDLAGCTARDSMTVFVSNGPLYAKLISPTVVCKGMDTCLRVNANGGEPPYEYIWWSQPEGFNSTTQDPIFCFTIDKTYTFFVDILDSEGTHFKDSALIFVPLINPIIYGDSLLCEYQTAVYNAPVLPGRSFQWSVLDLMPENSNAIVNAFTVGWGTGPDSGFIQVIETDTNSCSESVLFPIRIKPNPLPQISENDVYCQGAKDAYFSTIDVPGHTFQWNLSPGLGTFIDSTGAAISIDWDLPGKDNLILLETDTVFGCHTAVTKEITIRPVPKPLISGNVTVCQQEYSQYFTQYNEGSSYQWSLIEPSSGEITSGNKADSVQLFWDEPGIANLQVIETIDSSSCSGTSDTSITINARPELSLLAESLWLCDGDTTSIDLSGGDDYVWIPDEDIISVDNSSWWVFPGETTHYFITGTDTITQCADTLSFDIEIRPNPIIDLGEDRYISPGQTILLDPGAGYDAYFWSTGSTDQRLEVTSIGLYSVMVELQGCDGQDSIRITMPAGMLPIPNAFTPNGDWVNDTFGLVGSLEAITKYQMRIFNRMGLILFESTDPYQKWDGTYKGTACPIGAYYYTLYLEEGISLLPVEKQGYVNLLR